MIVKLAKALEAKDFVAASEVFAPEGVYVDYCPALLGKDTWHMNGRGCIEMLLRNKFTMGYFEIFDPVVEDEKNVNFFAGYDGVYVACRLTAEKCSDAGLVRVVARPL